MRRRHLLCLALLLCAGMAFRLLCVSGSPRELARCGPLVDDSFYAFAVARNIADGRGSTFDGEHETNGYQPLWMALLVALYRLAPGEEGAIRAALWLSILLNGCSAWVLWRLLRRRGSPGAALFGIALWAFAPVMVQQAANGLETSLALFCLGLALLHFVERFRPRPNRKNTLILGALLSLAVMARVDALLFVLAVCIDISRRRRLWRPGAVAAVVVLGSVGSWCVTSQVRLGAPLPESGEAMHLLSAAYAQPPARDSPVPLWARNVGDSLLLLGTSPALHGFTRAVQRGLQPWVSGPAWQSAAAGLVLLGALALAWRLRSGRRRDAGGLGFLVVYAAFLLGAYSLFVFGQIFFARYYYPLFFFSILLACDVFGALMQRSTARRRLLLWVAVGMYVSLLPGMAWRRTRQRDYRFVNAVQWLDAATPRNARVGVFNGGTIGYFSSRKVINLDGKVNHGALQALQQDRLANYLRRERVDYVLDHDRVLETFLLSRPDRGALHFHRVAGESEIRVPGWSAYRVQPLPTLTLGRAAPLP